MSVADEELEMSTVTAPPVETQAGNQSKKPRRSSPGASELARCSIRKFCGAPSKNRS